jgi:MscS family membrane protein
VVRKAAKVFLVITGSVMVVQNLGYSVASLLAGVGIGGAALAFASKDAVANVFGSIVIFVDRPFLIGDWIEVGDVEGTVESVGIRVTRVRTFANSVLTIPNAQFTILPINNWSRMRKRRIKLTVGLTYDATPDGVRAAVEAIRGIIRADDRLDQEFFLVNFHDFGESSLDIFCYLFTRTTDWTEHMQIRQEFMLAVMQAMADLDLQFAFPTRTVHVQGESIEAQPPGAPAAMLRERP